MFAFGRRHRIFILKIKQVEMGKVVNLQTIILHGY